MKRKVLIFTPGGLGGAERMSVLVGKILPKDRYYVKFVVIGRLQNIYNLIPDGYDFDCIPVRNIYTFSTFRILWRIIREKPDLVFVSQASYNARVIIASKIAGRKVIVRSTNMIGKYRVALRYQVLLTYPKADLLIAQQEEMRQEMIRLLKVEPTKVVTLNNPLDTTEIEKLVNVESTFLSNTINFVNVARITYDKAQDVAIKAFALVHKNLPNGHLYFIGGGNEKDLYYQSIKNLVSSLHLENSIHFVGFDQNPFRWVKNANCFVFPSRVEGLPNALIEASYLGIPCAATRCLQIVDDIIKNGINGYVVDVDDTEGLASAMMNSINIHNCKMIYKPSSVEDYISVFDSVQ